MNPYDILGVDKNSTQEDIKKAYRKLSKEYHPDRNQGNKDAEEKFKEIASAYDILSNPEKKQQYDTFGDGPFNGQGGFNGFSGFEDILSQMFGGNPFNRQRNRVGSDVYVNVTMSLNEIINGVQKQITYTKMNKCNTCNGKGGENVSKCGYCNGTGTVVRNIERFFGSSQQIMPCSHCDGTGNVINDKCNTCNGNGAVSTIETVKVSIPAGVHNGMQLTMQGSGNFIRDGIPGNLIIQIDEVEDENFKREFKNGNITNNLRNEMWISISEAVLGTSKIIKSPTGDLKFNIEPGCESGKIYNFNGKGIPNLSSDGRNFGAGNLYVKVNVNIPKKITDEEKKLFEEIGKYETRD